MTGLFSSRDLHDMVEEILKMQDFDHPLDSEISLYMIVSAMYTDRHKLVGQTTSCDEHKPA